VLCFIADHTVLAYSGAGVDNARTAAELLVAQGAARLISWGCAAALSATLKPGDLVLPDTLIDAEGNRLDIQSDWLKLASSLIKAHTGCLAESLTIVAAAKDKKRLHSQTGAIALDMESIAIAKVARQNNLPFLAIRAIADPVDMDLPKAISHALNAEGDIVLAKLLAFVVLHPAELPGLIKLGLHFNAAKNTLKSVAKQLDHLTATACLDR
jgi:Nucleoside phosphorylase